MYETLTPAAPGRRDLNLTTSVNERPSVLISRSDIVDSGECMYSVFVSIGEQSHSDELKWDVRDFGIVSRRLKWRR